MIDRSKKGILGMASESQAKVQVIDSEVTRRPLPIIDGTGSAFAILGPDNGAHFRTVNLLEMAGDDRTLELQHRHECVYYVQTGSGAIIDLANGRSQPLVEGSMIHIGPDDRYRLQADDSGMTVIGGCVPMDPTLYTETLAAE